MKIKADGWLHKYVIKFWDNKPEGLCWFFWKVVFTILAQIGIVLAAFTFCLGVLYTATLPIWAWFAWWDYPPVLLPVVSAMLWLFVGYVILRNHRDYLYETGKLYRPVKVKKEPGLIAQYWTALHHKVCPRMEYPNYDHI